MNRIKVTVAGAEYKLASDENPAYVMELARRLDHDMQELLNKNPRLSTAAAAVLCALDRADKAQKAIDAADNLRDQIKTLLDENDTLRAQVSTGQLRF